MTGRAWSHLRSFGRWTFAVLFILGGVAHFVSPHLYMRIMPSYLPWHRELVLLSGVFEILLGILLLVPQTSRPAAWGLVALLIAVFPANLFMYQHAEQFSVPKSLLLARLPLQAVLIAWAWAYTRPRSQGRPADTPGIGRERNTDEQV
ncbi:DoxX family protein [Singulisphaera rosea]